MKIFDEKYIKYFGKDRIEYADFLKALKDDVGMKVKPSQYSKEVIVCLSKAFISPSTNDHKLELFTKISQIIYPPTQVAVLDWILLISSYTNEINDCKSLDVVLDSFNINYYIYYKDEYEEFHNSGTFVTNSKYKYYIDYSGVSNIIYISSSTDDGNVEFHTPRLSHSHSIEYGKFNNYYDGSEIFKYKFDRIYTHNKKLTLLNHYSNDLDIIYSSTKDLFSIIYLSNIINNYRLDLLALGDVVNEYCVISRELLYDFIYNRNLFIDKSLSQILNISNYSLVSYRLNIIGGAFIIFTYNVIPNAVNKKLLLVISGGDTSDTMKVIQHCCNNENKSLFTI